MLVDLGLILSIMESLHFLQSLTERLIDKIGKNKNALDQPSTVFDEVYRKTIEHLSNNFESLNLTKIKYPNVFKMIYKEKMSLSDMFMNYLDKIGASIDHDNKIIYSKIFESMYINNLKQRISETNIYSKIIREFYLPRYFDKIEGTSKFIKVVKLINKGRFHIPSFYDDVYNKLINNSEFESVNIFGIPFSGKTLLVSYMAYKNILNKNNENKAVIIYFDAITQLEDHNYLIMDLRSFLRKIYGEIYVIIDNANRLPYNTIDSIISAIEELENDEDNRLIKAVFISRYPLTNNKLKYMNIPHTHLSKYYTDLIKNRFIRYNENLVIPYIKELEKLPPYILYRIQSKLTNQNKTYKELYIHEISRKETREVISSLIDNARRSGNKFILKILEAILSLSLAKSDLPLKREFFKQIIDVPEDSEDVSLFNDAYDKLIKYLIDTRKSIFEIIIDKLDYSRKIRVVNYNDKIIRIAFTTLLSKEATQVSINDRILGYLMKYIDVKCHKNSIYDPNCIDAIIDKIHERGYVKVIITLLKYILGELEKSECVDPYCISIKVHVKNKLVAEEARSNDKNIDRLTQTYGFEILNSIKILENYLKKERASAYYGLARLLSRKTALINDTDIVLKLLEKTREYYRMAEKDYQDLKDNFMLANIKHGYGLVKLRECIIKGTNEDNDKCMEEAIKYIKESNELLLRSFSSIEKNNEVTEAIKRTYGYNLAKIGQIKYFIGEYDKAKKDYSQAYLIGQEIGDAILEYVAKSGELLSSIESANNIEEIKSMENEIEELYEICMLHSSNRCLNYYRKVYISKQLRISELGGEIDCSEIDELIDKLEEDVKNPEDLVYLRIINNKFRKNERCKNG